MCSGPKSTPTPPPQAPEAMKILTTPDQAANTSGSRTGNTAKRALRIEIGGSTTGSGLNIPTS